VLLTAARQSFKEQEALVYQQLAQLIRDGVWLKSYLAAVMRLEHEAFQARWPCHASALIFLSVNKLIQGGRHTYRQWECAGTLSCARLRPCFMCKALTTSPGAQ
jgi:hypothetical protein